MVFHGFSLFFNGIFYGFAFRPRPASCRIFAESMSFLAQAPALQSVLWLIGGLAAAGFARASGCQIAANRRQAMVLSTDRKWNFNMDSIYVNTGGDGNWKAF